MLFLFIPILFQGKVMSIKKWSLILLPLFAAIILDQLTKSWAIGIQETIHFPFISIHLNLNQGLVLGLFSDLPKLLRVVSLSTGGSFLLFLYLLMQYLLTTPALLLRVGMSLFTGGVLGNAIDRIHWGFVVDFIKLGPPSFQTAIFNLADLFQIVGFILIVYALIKEGDRLWPENEGRKSFWINKKFQFKYSLILTGAGFCLSIITLIFCYTYLRIVLSELPFNAAISVNKILMSFIIIYSLISLVFCVCLFFFGKFISHRIAGPLYAFERFLDNLLDGKHSELRLRTGDEFKHLEEVSIKLQEKLENFKL
jgi:signal peptidase II